MSGPDRGPELPSPGSGPPGQYPAGGYSGWGAPPSPGYPAADQLGQPAPAASSPAGGYLQVAEWNSRDDQRRAGPQLASGSPGSASSVPPSARRANPAKLIGLGVAALGVLNFICGFLPELSSNVAAQSNGNLSVFAVGPAYVPILLLIAGLLAFAALLPGSERSRLAVAAVSVGGAIGAIVSLGTPGVIEQFASPSQVSKGLGAILLVVFGIVQAVVAIVGYVVGAGVTAGQRGRASGSSIAAAPAAAGLTGAGAGQYGAVPVRDSGPYGAVPTDAQYGAGPTGAHYGSAPSGAQYGSAPSEAQYGAVPSATGTGQSGQVPSAGESSGAAGSPANWPQGGGRGYSQGAGSPSYVRQTGTPDAQSPRDAATGYGWQTDPRNARAGWFPPAGPPSGGPAQDAAPQAVSPTVNIRAAGASGQSVPQTGPTNLPPAGYSDRPTGRSAQGDTSDSNYRRPPAQVPPTSGEEPATGPQSIVGQSARSEGQNPKDPRESLADTLLGQSGTSHLGAGAAAGDKEADSDSSESKLDGANRQAADFDSATTAIYARPRNQSGPSQDPPRT